jgi:hypothetical protein
MEFALQYQLACALLLLGLQPAFRLQRMKYEERLLLQVLPEYGAFIDGALGHYERVAFFAYFATQFHGYSSRNGF